MNYLLRASNFKNSKQKQLPGLSLSRVPALLFTAKGKILSPWKEPSAHVKPATRNV